jgi:protein gp37
LLEVGDERTIRFLSIEPQWEAIDLGESLSRLDWIIQGGQSGKDAPAFDLAWARALRDACQKAGVPYFLKQLGARVQDGTSGLELRDGHGGDWDEWPEELRVRQLPPLRPCTLGSTALRDEGLPALIGPGLSAAV